MNLLAPQLPLLPRREKLEVKRAGLFNPQTVLQRRAEDGRKTQGYHQAPLMDPIEILLEASAYLYGFHQEHGMLNVSPERLNQVQVEIEQTGIYRQTYEELAYGAKVAWRNNTRCIGRLHWKSLA